MRSTARSAARTPVADLHHGVEGVISASDFVEIAEGAQIVFV